VAKNAGRAKEAGDSLANRLRRAGVKPRLWTPDPRLLLLPQVPRPLHGLAPRVVLGAKWWDATRQAAYRSTAYHCLACGVYKGDAVWRKWLEAHEVYAVDYLAGRATYERAVPLCHLCHAYIHCGRSEALVERGEMNHLKYAAIMQHGDAVLGAAGLRRLPPYDGPFAPWDDWRLVVGSKEYEPLRTEQEWIKEFGRA
jgi:hypothetical protein